MGALIEYFNSIGNFFVEHGFDFLFGVIVLIGGIVIVRICAAIIRAIIRKTKTTNATAQFVVSLISAILYIVIIIIALSIMGMNTASILTVIATGGVAIGLALKDSLGNIASGIIIIVNKPFKIGDYIIVGGVEGLIYKINLFNTILRTWDNKVVIVPNSVAVNNPLVNCDAASTRRVDIELNLAYGSNIDEARQIVANVLDMDDRLLVDKPYALVLSAYKDSSLNLSVRAWVDTTNYWAVKFDLQENIYNALYKAGIRFAFNHITVDTSETKQMENKHLIQEKELTSEESAEINKKIEEATKKRAEKYAANNKSKKDPKAQLKKIIKNENVNDD